jgi:hypothetical protein
MIVLFGLLSLVLIYLASQTLPSRWTTGRQLDCLDVVLGLVYCAGALASALVTVMLAGAK